MLLPTTMFGRSNCIGTVITMTAPEMLSAALKWTPSPPVEANVNASRGVAS